MSKNYKLFAPLLLVSLLFSLIPSSGTYAQTTPSSHQIFLPHISNNQSEQSDQTRVNAAIEAQQMTLGDVNCDGRTDTVDALFIMQEDVGMRDSVRECPIENPARQINVSTADVNNDGRVNVVDALMIMQCVVGIENVFCDNSPEPPDPPEPLQNVAFGKAAEQSSIIYQSDAASTAVDGHLPAEFSIGETTRTKTEQFPWWQVDLGAIYDLSTIRLVQFTDDLCCHEQSKLYVLVSKQPFQSTDFEQARSQAGAQVYRYQGGELEIGGAGRYIRLQLDTEQEYSLVLGEVQVTGALAEGQDEPAFRSNISMSVGTYDTGRLRADAVESTGRTVLLHFTRATAVDEVTLGLTYDGSGDPTRASAREGDYVLLDETGTQITPYEITLSPGTFERRIEIEALSDGIVEVPEALTIQLTEQPSYDVDPNASIVQLTLRDGEPGIRANSRLLFGEMVPENGAVTEATGIATIQLSDDNSYGVVNASFAQLTSVESAAHIHAEPPGNSGGPAIFDLPLGQITNRRWSIEAEAHLATDQEMLDALLAGELYVNIHTANYPGGEIRATLRGTQASVVMQPVPAADPIEVLTGDELKRDVVRFLTQATFGPTPDSVDEMLDLIDDNNGDRIAAYDEWISNQIALTSPSMLEYFQASRKLYLVNDVDGEARDKFSNISNGVTPGWFASSVYGKNPLRERFGFALSETFVVSIEGGGLQTRPWAAVDFYDMLRDNAFGPYEKLLTDVSRHPAMGFYLSHLKNRASTDDGNFAPDENYAREIMQLFSIGLVNLHLDGTLKLNLEGLPTRTYDQDDITNLARVFTGWNFDPTKITNPNHVNNFSWLMHVTKATDNHPYLWSPMTMWEDNGRSPTHPDYVRYHDNGAKTVLGVNIPAGQPGEDDLYDVMDILSTHENTAPFISYRLIQRLVTSNPSRGYIHRVAETFTNTNGNLGEVVRAILLDPEARNLDQIEKVTYGKMKEPLVHLTNVMRLVRPQTVLTATHNLDTLVQHGLPITETAKYEDDMQLVSLNYKRFGRQNDGFFQAPLQAPSVFNWFLPSYAPAGQIAGSGLVAPELQHATESNTIAYYNVFHRYLQNTTGTPKNRGLLGESPQAKYIPPGYTTPQPYINTSYDVQRAVEWLGDIYIAALDEVAGDGIAIGNPAYTNPTAVRAAIGAMVDAVDLYVCAGRLQFEATGDLNTDPREIIITGVQEAWDGNDGKTGPAYVTNIIDERVRDTLLLVSAAPQCLIQR